MAKKSESPVRSVATVAAGRGLESGKLSFPTNSNTRTPSQGALNHTLAQCFARDGFPLLPLDKTGRRTLASLPATDSDLITAWWEKHPDAVPALATGFHSGLLALVVSDGTTVSPELLAALRCDDVRDLTPAIAEHPNRSVHLFFRLARPQRIRTVRDLAPGIDLIADGGSVIAPGAMFSDGSRMRWIDTRTDLADAAPAPAAITSGRLIDGGGE